MSEFARYRSVGGIRERLEIPLIDVPASTEISEIARLTALRERQPVEESTHAINRRLSLGPQKCRLFSARLNSRIVGYGWVQHLAFNTIPEGWYLAGMCVDPSVRRLGIGTELTVHRLKWLASRTNDVYYFANSRNRASIELHARLGFKERRRNIAVQNCSFEGGTGILYRLDLTHRSVLDAGAENV